MICAVADAHCNASYMLISMSVSAYKRYAAKGTL